METKLLTKKDYLAEFCGNKVHAADFLGITRQAIQQWKEYVPRKHYIDLAHMRPKQWGYLIRR